jgi:hypothetical protein
MLYRESLDDLFEDLRCLLKAPANEPLLTAHFSAIARSIGFTFTLC